MSREALHMHLGGTNALEAFAAVMLGEHPFAPSEEAVDLARLAPTLTRDRSEPVLLLRALYGLAREHAGSGARKHPEPDKPETKPARCLRLMLGLRHRQRAALALRFVLGFGVEDVAAVLGVSPGAADEVVRAGLAAIARGAGSKMDVRRNLRSFSSSLAPMPDPGPRAEPRNVVRLLLAPPPLGTAERAARLDRVVFEARPIYGPIEVPEREAPVADVPAPPSAPRAPRRRAPGALRSLLAAAAAIVVLFVFALSFDRGLVAPIAAAPLAPRISASVPRATSGVLATVAGTRFYRVRAGDTLWSIASRSLGNPYRWPEIWRANARGSMRGGARFTDPNLIRPGWMLAMPPGHARGGG
jgi:nucleoid-associated protein YgaU